MSPATTLRSVVFPAPFGPKIASVWPAATEKETSSRARTGPKEWRSPSASSIDRGGELAQFVRFDEISAVPQVEHVHQRLHTHVRRRDHYRQRGTRFADALEERDPVGVGKSHVEHEHIGLEIIDLPDRLGTIRGIRHRVFRLEKALVGVLQGGLVLDEQDLTRDARFMR